MVLALAATAAAALLQAVVTDDWEGVRHKVTRLFGRGQPDAAIERRLDATRDQLTAAAPGEVETVRAALAAQWETRFADLLADHPGAEAELAALVKEIRPAVTAADHAVAAHGNVTATAWRTGMTGDAAGARDQFAALLPVRERVSGPEHPGTLTARSNLARWTGQAGDAAGARDQFAALLPVRERVLGPDHPDTLSTRSILADWTGQAGDAG